MAKTITHEDNDETKPALFGEKDHIETSKQKSFTQMIFETLTEREPSDNETKILDLILNLSIDHGPNSPSGKATIEAANSSKPMGESVGEGIAQINDSHGGAGAPLMEILYEIEKGNTNAQEVVKNLLSEEKRLPGVGHRVYKDLDPRANIIMETALSLGVGARFIEIAKELKSELNNQSGKNLPINIDGAIAAVFCGFGLDPKLGIAVFIIARTPGLCAHFINSSS